MQKYLTLYETQADYDAGERQYPNVSYIKATDEVVWQKTPDYSKEYLTFVALESGTFKFSCYSTVNYSIDDGQTWTSLASNTDSPTIAVGQKIMWKGELTPRTLRGIGTFSSTGQFTVDGNPMSLLFGDNFQGQTSLSGKNYAFYTLFMDATGLTSAANLVLPATTLANSCYRGLFYGCTSLVAAPQLPATTLATNCYSSLFEGCTSLVAAPQLPATTLASDCYYGLFKNCTSLNSITCLATDISAYNCLTSWTSGVASTGTFTKAASMTSWPSGTSGIPTGWTVQDAPSS